MKMDAAAKFAAQAWRVDEFAGSIPAIAELRNTLQWYGGAQYLKQENRQERDSNKNSPR